MYFPDQMHLSLGNTKEPFLNLTFDQNVYVEGYLWLFLGL